MPELVRGPLREARSKYFDSRRWDDYQPRADDIWQGGGDTFLNKGTNGRWRGIYSQQDLDLYDAKVKEEFPPELAHWIACGRPGS